MKALILVVVLTGCTLTMPERDKKKNPTPIDKLHSCVVDLIGRLNVSATTAEEVCAKIYKRMD